MRRFGRRKVLVAAAVLLVAPLAADAPILLRADRLIE